MNKTAQEEIRKEMNEIFDGCYSKELSACPKHTVFLRQLAINKLIAAGFRKMSRGRL